eukprot:TRINITY_DN20958_c0_g1_i1.p1 TRINITY_DN20958_c0_g1~~TRINITY_DN20958_c0_g1_i1.p1  ORF type:complete len:544 (+),score=144.77 TRINITY_DN20958_c0_g1_i1:85-1716(+)
MAAASGPHLGPTVPHALRAEQRLKAVRDAINGGQMRGLAAGLEAQDWAQLTGAVSPNAYAAAGHQEPTLTSAALDLEGRMHAMRERMDAPGGNAVLAPGSHGLVGLLQDGHANAAFAVRRPVVDPAAFFPVSPPTDEAAHARVTSPVRNPHGTRPCPVFPAEQPLRSLDVQHHEAFITGIDNGIDERVLEMMAREEKAAQDVLDGMVAGFDEAKRTLLQLGMDVLKTKAATQNAQDRAAAVRDDVKLTQAELSCVALEVHTLERARRHVQPGARRQPACQAEQHRADAELVKAKLLNRKYPAEVAQRHEQTAALEKKIKECTEEDGVVLMALKERWASVAKELRQRASAEEEWGALKLLIGEQEKEILDLRRKIESVGGHVPAAVTAARQVYAEKLRKDAHVSPTVKNYFAVPAGTLCDITTTQGYGLQGIRAKHNVVIDVATRDGWADNIISIAGSEENVEAAKREIEQICCRPKPKKVSAVLTYPRPDNRVGPIATPWARLQEQAEEEDVESHHYCEAPEEAAVAPQPSDPAMASGLLSTY